MKKKNHIRILALLFLLAIVLVAITYFSDAQTKNTNKTKNTKANQMFEINKTETEWEKELSPEQFRILREKGTERAFSGKYNIHFEDGFYSCAGCGNKLFDSKTKFHSHCGWPSFYDVDSSKIKTIEDNSFGMKRTEVVCAKCGGHLGHVFDDGPKPTGLRYCINSVSISFKKDTTKD